MLSIRLMTLADLDLGLHLSRQAGWNQTEADWRRFLTLQPDGCFVAEWLGVPVGTTSAFCFGPVAWLAMVLVEGEHRGQGIGGALVRHALDFVAGRGVAAVRLDATPLGQPLYKRLGFVEQFTLARYEGILPSAPPVTSVELATAEQWDELVRLDTSITGTERGELLPLLFAEEPAAVRVVRRGETAVGYLAQRRGAQAIQLGPCIADPQAGPLLFADACQRLAGQSVFVDIPLANGPACRWAESHGLIVQRQLTRMGRGRLVQERLDWLWASSGPEKG